VRPGPRHSYDPPELRKLIVRLDKTRPGTVRMVGKLVRGIERVLAEKRQNS
jgi:hypothetical protein